MLRLVLVSLALAALVPFREAQSVIRVPGDAPTIQDGIIAAQDGDTVLVAPGTYDETIEYFGKAIVVASEGGAGLTTIDATGLFDTAVRFYAGEGPGSVLRGFLVMGGNAPSTSMAGGISGFDTSNPLVASPTVQQCIVRGNRSELGFAGGIFSDGLIEDCVVETNKSTYAGGGIAGSPTVRRCIIRFNGGYDGGGLYLFGGRIEDSTITGNEIEEGTRGGGVCIDGSGVSLLRCVIAGNMAHATGLTNVSSAGVFAYGARGVTTVVNCTIARNRFTRIGPASFDDCGGVSGPVQLVNSIVRENDGTQLIQTGGALAIFSNVQGGTPGDGNFDADPLFVDPARGDFGLRAGSPCIDTGARAAPLDPDCTRADVGARYYAQPCVQIDNGNGVNPSALSAVGQPALGAMLVLRVDASVFPGAALTLLSGHEAGLAGGSPTPWGELLIAGPSVYFRLAPSTGILDAFSLNVPREASLIGRELHVQAAVESPSGARLTNALVLKVGH